MAHPVVLSQGSLPDLEPLIRRYCGSTVLPAIGGYRYGEGGGAEFASNSILWELERGGLEAVALPGRSGYSGAILSEGLEWDTEVLGLSCARIRFIAGEGCELLLDFWKERAASLGVRYVTLRLAEKYGTGGEGSEFNPDLDATVDTVAGLLEAAGFDKLERLVYVRGKTDCPDTPRKVEEAHEDDIEEIIEIAQSSYTFDRFHREKLFSEDTVKRLHRMWFLGSFHGRADKILVVRDGEGRIGGYITCVLPRVGGARAGVLDMLAIRENVRRQKYAMSLLFGAMGFFRENGYKEAACGTQEQNHPARALYDRIGFEEYNSTVTYRLKL